MDKLIQHKIIELNAWGDQLSKALDEPHPDSLYSFFNGRITQLMTDIESMIAARN